MNKQKKAMSSSLITLLAISMVVLVSAHAHANVDHFKAYKKSYPDETPHKCSICHVSEKPKKDDGQHDLNAYGLKALELKKADESKAIEDIYPALGSSKDFKAEE